MISRIYGLLTSFFYVLNIFGLSSGVAQQIIYVLINEFVGEHFKIIEKRYWVHTGVGGKVEKVPSKISIRFWVMLASIWPSLFARGIIFLCKRK